MVSIIVLARPILSPSMPKISPPVAQPAINTDVEMSPKVCVQNLKSGLSFRYFSRSSIACGRAKMKSCWSRQSNNHPKAQTARTNQ